MTRAGLFAGHRVGHWLRLSRLLLFVRQCMCVSGAVRMRVPVLVFADTGRASGLMRVVLTVLSGRRRTAQGARVAAST